MSKKVRVAIVGCGGIANGKHMPSLKANADKAEMVAFCDIIPERAKKAATDYGTPEAKTYTDYKEMLADKIIEFDVVHVCTPNVVHCPVAVAAFEAGKHVMCEKPMAHSTSDAQKMLDAWKKSRKKFTIGYQNRLRDDTQTLYASCKAGELGEIYFANTVLCFVIAATAGILIVSLLYPKLKVRIGSSLICFFSITAIVENVMTASKINQLLTGVSDVRISFGTFIIIILGFVLLTESLYALWKQKVVSALDFMILPGMLYFIINNYIPMFGIYIAFKKVDYSLGFWKSPWCGFDNFKILFSGTGSFFKSDAFIITRNTLLYNLAFIIIGTIMGIVVGICLADIFSKKWQKFFQTSILLPQLISMVIVAYIVYAFFSNETGMLNKILGDKNAVNFYCTPKYWPFILIFISTWKMLGYNSIIFLSSIVGIDKSLYEAANVDGANKWVQIKYVTLPLLKPTIITVLLLQTGRIFYSDFGLFYQVPMNSGALYTVTNTIDTYVYRALMVSNNISMASAVSTYQAIVGFIIVLSVNMIVRKLDRENALF